MYFSRIRIQPEIYKSTQFAKVLSDNTYSKHRLLWDLFPGQAKRDFLYREEIAREQIGIRAGVRGEPIYYIVSATAPFSKSPFFQVETREYQPKLQQGDRLRFELRANPIVTTKVDRENSEHYLRERSRRKAADKNKLTKKRVRHDVVMNTQRTFLTSLCTELKLQSILSSTPKKQEYKKVLLAHGGLALDKRLTALLKDDFRYSERLNHTMALYDKLEWSIKAIIDASLDKWMVRQGERNAFLVLKDKYGQLKLQNSAYQWHALMQKKFKGKKSGFSSVDFVGELEITDVEVFKKALFEGIGRSKAFGCGLMLVKRI